MQTTLIYLATIIIWGSTWIMIKFQLGVVPPQVSIVYRFVIAALVLILFALLAKRRLRISLTDLPYVALQGVFMFAANYYFVYAGTAFVTSGLVAVLFTALVLMNALNERLFFGTRISGMAIIAGILSLTGIGMMFWPEIRTLSFADDAIKGIALILLGAFTASLGNMAAIHNMRRRVPVIAVNIHGMAIGATCSALFAMLSGQPFIMHWETRYVSSLLFLAIPGTAIAFGLYLVLIERIGAAKAAYTAVMLPIVALLISTIFEDYKWSWLALLGLVIAVTGNAIALMAKTPPKIQTTT